MNDTQVTPVITAAATSSPRPQASRVGLDDRELDVRWEADRRASETRDLCITKVIAAARAQGRPIGSRVAVIVGSQCLGADPSTSRYYPPTPEDHVRKLLPDAQVRMLVLSHACASTGVAVGVGADLCRSGVVDTVLVCSSSIDGPLEEDTFHDARAWAPEVRPFDANAAGTRVYGFAGAVLIQGIKGSATPTDIAIRGWHARSVGGKTISDPDEELLVMAEATRKAGLVPHLVIAHATGTRQGDRAELEAIERFAEAHSVDVEVLANKGALGHAVFAAGVASVATAVRALNGSAINGSYGLRTPVRQVNGVTLEEETDSTLSRVYTHHRSAIVNGFGFSGSNVAVVLERMNKDEHPVAL